MRMIMLDPGSEVSSYVLVDSAPAVKDWKIIKAEERSNEEIVDLLRGAVPQVRKTPCLVDADLFIYEHIEPRGEPLWRQTCSTIYWYGRFHQAWGDDSTAHSLTRENCSMHLRNMRGAKSFRPRLITMFPETGGGKTPAVGTKAKPGPLYGIKDHMWSALGVGVTWWETERLLLAGGDVLD